ncbi:MAG: MBL fold metallo-hydrolase [Candidatus Omnitrophica bacterium]|nr:MBL fold metallo-hydrolase [Candidatus Omnitrophota bacterium]
MNVAQPKLNPFAPRVYGDLKKVTEHVYVMRNITNSSFVIGQKGVAVIDTQVNRPSAELLLKMVRSVTDKPILYVINTHYHWDHTNGNQVFKNEGARVISSKMTKEFMTARAPRQKEFLAGRGFELGQDPFLPEITFENEHGIDLGDMPLRLFFAGRAETDDATAVHILRENVIASGDTVMTGSFPIFGQPVWDEGLEGDEDWIQTIRCLTALKPSVIIPGHGPLAGDKEIEFLIAIERYFIDEVKKLVEKGLGIEAVLRDLEPRLPDWITQIPMVWGTPRYAALRVFRGLTKKPNDQGPGWQWMKPSAMAAEAKEGGDGPLRLAILKKAVEESPDSCDALNAYAEALVEESRREASVLEKGDYFEEARRAWEKVLNQDPKNLGALLGKGRYLTMMAYRGGDDPAGGMALLKQVIEMAPGGRPEAEAHFYLGMGFRRLGDEARARAQYQKSLSLDPSFMPARMVE